MYVYLFTYAYISVYVRVYVCVIEIPWFQIACGKIKNKK